MRIETLGETGAPRVIADHRSQIRSLAPLGPELTAGAAGTDVQRGCMATPSRRIPVAAPLSLLALASGLLIGRRRRRMVG